MRRWLFMLTVVLFFSSCSVRLITQRTYNRYVKDAPYDAIVVPGMRYESTSQNSLYKARMQWAKMLYDSGIARNIIFSGGAVYTPYNEGSVMKIFADSMGIPAAHTFAETQAMHSNENVYYGFKMARALGFKKVALATDPFQSWMYGLYIKSYKGGLPRLPLALTKLRAFNKPLPAIDAHAAMVNDFIPIKKTPGGFVKRLRHSFSYDAVLRSKEHPSATPEKNLVFVQ